ncbi:hypothetical protein [Parapedobacter soli]|nr:hypothetical protein [Parapedobacter soli]
MTNYQILSFQRYFEFRMFWGNTIIGMGNEVFDVSIRPTNYRFDF